MKLTRSLLAAWAALLLLATAAQALPPQQADGRAQGPSVLVSPEPPPWEDHSGPEAPWAFDGAEVRRIVTDLPPEASVEQVDLALFELLPQVFSATNRDRPAIGEALVTLRKQPAAAEAIALQYERLPRERFNERLLVLSMLGELRRTEAAPLLLDVIWAPLPVSESTGESLSDHDFEEMLQAKAVHGLAYLRSYGANQALREVMTDHESMHVRISAIDAYMWNRGDARPAAEELYDLLPEEMHMFVERPRFKRGVDARAFAQKLAEWQAKWGKEPQGDPNSELASSGGEQ